MNKKLFAILIIVTLVCACCFTAGCSVFQKDEVKPVEMTRMTVDINPSIEFMVDAENKVVSATALNDDGSIILAGEALVGKTSDEAVKAVVSIATDTGYIVKGDVEASENTVKISVSGNTAYAEKLVKDATAKVNKFFEDNDIKGAVEKIEALNLEALKAIALNNSIYTKEEIDAMSEEELLKVISIGRIETAELLTEEMREAYFKAKEYEIDFAEREITGEIIGSINTIYQLTYQGYKSALKLYHEAIVTVEETRYNLLVSPDSDYQKLLTQLRESKSEILKQKTIAASLDVNGEEYASIQIKIQASEEQYDLLLEKLESAGQTVNSAIDVVLENAKKLETTLIEFEKNHFSSDDITAELNQKAQDIENKLNAEKDSFFASFEEAHGDDITELETSLKAQKDKLIAEINKKSE